MRAGQDGCAPSELSRATIGFAGLGHMGTPMANRLAAAGHRLRVYDIAPAARARHERLDGVAVVNHVAEIADGADVVILMLGGPASVLDRLRPVLEVLGSQVMHAGDIVGAGHAVKALNNLMSAAHLLASSEALLAGRQFGLDPEVMLSIVNSSSGRSGSTQLKWPKYILPETYDSDFGLRLMLKDMRIALQLAQEAGVPAPLGQAAAAAWAAAAEDLPPAADHTEIARWLAARIES